LELVRFTDLYLPQETAKMRFTENHDQPRFAESVQSFAALKAWTAFMAFMRGCFQIYAGQESGNIRNYF
jgi:glycosidase